MGNAGRCFRCKQPVLWVHLKDSGKNLPIDFEAQPRAKGGLVAYNSQTGGGRIVSVLQLKQFEKWGLHAPITYHRNHLTACPANRAAQPPKEATG